MRGAVGLIVVVAVAALGAACGGGGGQRETQATPEGAAEVGVTHAVESDAATLDTPPTEQSEAPAETVAQAAPAPVDYAPHRGTRREGVPAVGRTLGHPTAPILVEEWSDFQ